MNTNEPMLRSFWSIVGNNPNAYTSDEIVSIAVSSEALFGRSVFFQRFMDEAIIAHKTEHHTNHQLKCAKHILIAIS